MSEVTERPSVKSVTPEAVAASAVLLGVAAVVFTGKALFEAIARTNQRLSEHAQRLDASVETLSSLDAHKLNTIASLNSAAYVLPPNSIQDSLSAVLEAPNVKAA